MVAITYYNDIIKYDGISSGIGVNFKKLSVELE
jgi:hypothetical protein